MESGAAAHLGKGAVAVVVEQQAGRRSEHSRDTVIPTTERVLTAGNVGLERELDEAAHEQVGSAVAVVIEPDGAGRPAWRRNAGFLGHVAEGAVAVVVIERAPAICGHEQVRIAIVIVVSDRHAHAERAAWNARLFGDIGKGAIPVVLVERVADGLRRREEIARPAVYQIDVHPAVAVEIEERAPRTARLGQIPFGRPRILVYPRHAAADRRYLDERRLHRRFKTRDAGGRSSPAPAAAS